MALSEAQKAIKRINRAIDAIVRKYGSESDLYKEAVKYFYGGDVPKTVKSKAGVLHVSRGKVNLSRPLQLKAIEKHIKDIKLEAKKSGEDFALKYARAKGDLEDMIAQYYTLRQEGKVSQRDTAKVEDALDSTFREAKEKPTKSDVVKAYDILRRIKKE